MAIGAKRIVREVGTAVAVLAMYALLLLAPWHQSSALQHDLAELGYASTASIDICGSPIVDGDQDQHSEALKCPIAGIGKFEFTFVEPPSLALPSVTIVPAVVYPINEFVGHSSLAPHVGQARAPPVTA